MLSRVAEQLYWMARYVERAQNLARIINVLAVQTAESQHAEMQWGGLLRHLGESHPEMFHQDVGTIVNHLLYDESCPVSVHWCVTRARENGRVTRDVISRELWQGLTALHHLFAHPRELTAKGDGEFSGILEQVILQAHAFQGMVDSTLLQDEGFHFMQIGLNLERALATVLVLEANLGGLIHKGKDESPALGISVLKSVTAYAAFRHIYRALNARDIVEFLVFERRVPRSVIASLTTVQESLSTLPDGKNNKPGRVVGRVCSHLSYDALPLTGSFDIAAYLQHLGNDIRQIHSEIQARYFNPEVVAI